MASASRRLEPAEVRDVLARHPRRARTIAARGRNAVARVVSAAAARIFSAIETIRRRPAVECPICGWRGLRFRPLPRGRIYWNVMCPACRSLERHRLFWLVWNDQELPGTVCLHLSPEPWLRDHVSRKAQTIVRLDIAPGDVDVLADAQALPLTSSSVGWAVCSDVLEHVLDDRRALTELGRVLQEDGVALLHVPVIATETVEYGEALAWDHGHRRAYGPDVEGRIRESQLDVDVRRADDYSPSDIRRFGLRSDDLVFIARPLPTAAT